MKTAFVILNEVKNLMHSIRYTTQILRLTPQNDITTQSHEGEGRVRVIQSTGIQLPARADCSTASSTFCASSPSRKLGLVCSPVLIP